MARCSLLETLKGELGGLEGLGSHEVIDAGWPVLLEPSG